MSWNGWEPLGYLTLDELQAFEAEERDLRPMLELQDALNRRLLLELEQGFDVSIKGVKLA